MSDYYDDSFDSFESGSESESGENQSGERGEVLLQQVQDPRVRELNSLGLGRGYSSHSDQEDPGK